MALYRLINRDRNGKVEATSKKVSELQKHMRFIYNLNGQHCMIERIKDNGKVQTQNANP
jgi:hypothetical protein